MPMTENKLKKKKNPKEIGKKEKYSTHHCVDFFSNCDKL